MRSPPARPRRQLRCQPSRMALPAAVTQIHSSIELGYRSNGVTGSERHVRHACESADWPAFARPDTFHAVARTTMALLFDDLYLSSFGWGGDPNNAMRLRADKNKWYNLQSSFRRDQNFSDFDLLANPLNPPYVDSVDSGAELAPRIRHHAAHERRRPHAAAAVPRKFSPGLFA